MYNYTLQVTRHAKFDFDMTTGVVWAGVFLPSFLFLFSSAPLQVATAD